MCGRYSQAANLAALAKRFGVALAEIEEIRPRFNLAPSEEALAIVQSGGVRRFEKMRWGVFRQWDVSRPPLFIINLKAEKLAKGPFKSVLSKRRCLIPADGFYEWKTEGRKKFPYRFTLKENALFAFPALYDEAAPEAKHPQRLFCIFTTEANSLVAPVHHRMPAILPLEKENAWLDSALTDPQKIVELLQPYPPDLLNSWEVSTLLNSAKYDDPDLIRPVIR